MIVVYCVAGCYVALVECVPEKGTAVAVSVDRFARDEAKLAERDTYG